jgi:anti-sigma factor RsiW
VKCSLLTLSTFIDDELPTERRAEVDAHLVGCTRCSAGAATLRAEKARVGRLARVQIDQASAQVMLEQVGIAIEPAISLSASSPPPPPPGGQLPWRGGAGGSALPWTPQRPTPTIAAVEEVPVPDVSADLQPDLPLDGMRTAQPWREAAATSTAASSAEMPAAVTDPRGGVVQPEQVWADADEAWLEGAASDSWEADLPPPVDPVSEGGKTWTAPPAPPVAWQPPTPSPPPVLPPVPVSVPTRVPAASGAAALWSRARDAVAVRLALSRGSQALDDSVQIVSGAPMRRGAELPSSDPLPPPEVDAAAARRLEAEAELGPSIELNGAPGVGLRSHAARDPRITASSDVEDRLTQPRTGGSSLDNRAGGDKHTAVPAAAEPWHAFAASSYPVESVADEAPATPPRPLGRHGRALARDRVGLVTRISAALTAAATALRGGMATASGSARTRLRGVSKAGPDNRMLAGIAGIGLIFVIALLIGHASAPVRAPSAARPASSSAAVTQPQHSAPARSSAPPSTTAVLPANVQTFGSGAAGFQVARLRYGKQATYMRVVVDLTAATGAVTGTPKVTIAFTDPKTVLMTLSGTAPAGSIVAPPTGMIISSVTLVHGSAQSTEYRITLDRPATATAFFLLSPARFVLDLH